MVARLQRDISFHSFTSPGPGLDLLGEQHSFTSPGPGLDLHLDLAWTYLENNIPSPHLGLAWTGPRPRPRPRPRTGPGPRPGPGLHLDLDYTWTWTWTWTSPGHQRFLQIRCLLRFLLQLHLLHLDLLLLRLPRPVIKLVQLQVLASAHKDVLCLVQAGGINWTGNGDFLHLLKGVSLVEDHLGASSNG